MVSPLMRIENDFLGQLEISNDRYYGIQTHRAVDNFPISGVKLSHFPAFIHAFAEVKKAAARANHKLQILEEDKFLAIVRACDRVIAGEFDNQFVVDCIQGGAGTSTNMNVNEVIANVALEELGEAKGRYSVIHPNNHVNLGQSTNDTYPPALSLSLIRYCDLVLASVDRLADSFEDKAKEFDSVIKMGRTQLQDAVPMTLGQEFRAFSVSIREELARFKMCQTMLLDINLGGTAIGTGISADPRYADLAVGFLSEQTGLSFQKAPNLIEASWDTSTLLHLAMTCRRTCVKVSKICNDLRLLSSGPRCGINEINLPQLQPGSSIMPGKVNPVIPEVVNQVCFDVFGADVTITHACEAGQLQLNVMVPIVSYRLFLNLTQMEQAFNVLSEKCVKGITANSNHCRELVSNSVGLVTALMPLIGYEKASKLAKEALRQGRSIKQMALESQVLSEEEIDLLLKPENLTTNEVVANVFEVHRRKGRALN